MGYLGMLCFLWVLYLLFCGFITWVSMSHIPVSAVVSSDGAVVGVFIIRLIMLSSIFCCAFSSAFVVVHAWLIVLHRLLLGLYMCLAASILCSFLCYGTLRVQRV